MTIWIKFISTAIILLIVIFGIALEINGMFF